MPPTALEFYQHRDAVQTVRDLREAHPEWSLDVACAKAKVSRAAYYRYEKEVEQGEVCIKDRNPGGRPPKFLLQGDELNALRACAAQFDSTDYAIEQFARDPHCQHETREMILDELDRAARSAKRPRWPDSIRRAAHLTKHEKAELRGQKASQAISLAPRKGMFWEDTRGERHLIKTHSAWMMDDYSTNQPYIIEGSTGQRTCRQMLVCKDLYSAMWLGVEAIGRERDAYRAEDILRFILHCIDAQGTMPAKLILERGRWDSIAVHGITVWDGSRDVAWGDLDAIIDIDHGYSSRHKGALESDLNILQRHLAHSGTDIGRTRGEFENATKAMLAVNAGRRDGFRNGFLAQQESVELHARAMDELNRRPKTREAFDHQVVPVDLARDTIAPRPLPASERWRFLPLKREATIRRGGLIEVSVKDYPRTFLFAVNGVTDTICLENGYKVLIAFDPARPDLGCVVANGEHGVKNRQGYKFGEQLLIAPVFEDVAQWSEAPRMARKSAAVALDGNEALEVPHDLKRRAAAAHRTGFAGVKKNLRDRSALRITQTHDHQGRVQRASNQAEAPMVDDEVIMTARTRRPRTLSAEQLAERERRAMEAESFA